MRTHRCQGSQWGSCWSGERLRVRGRVSTCVLVCDPAYSCCVCPTTGLQHRVCAFVSLKVPKWEFTQRTASLL